MRQVLVVVTVAADRDDQKYGAQCEQDDNEWTSDDHGVFVSAICGADPNGTGCGRQPTWPPTRPGGCGALYICEEPVIQLTFS